MKQLFHFVSLLQILLLLWYRHVMQRHHIYDITRDSCEISVENHLCFNILFNEKKIQIRVGNMTYFVS